MEDSYIHATVKLTQGLFDHSSRLRIVICFHRCWATRMRRFCGTNPQPATCRQHQHILVNSYARRHIDIYRVNRFARSFLGVIYMIGAISDDTLPLVWRYLASKICMKSGSTSSDGHKYEVCTIFLKYHSDFSSTESVPWSRSGRPNSLIRSRLNWYLYHGTLTLCSDMGCLDQTRKPHIFLVEALPYNKSLLIAPCKGQAIDSCRRNSAAIDHDIILVADGTIAWVTARLVAARKGSDQPSASITHVFHVSKVYHYKLPGVKRNDFVKESPAVCKVAGVPTTLSASVFSPDVLTTWHDQTCREYLLLDGKVEEMLNKGSPPIEMLISLLDMQTAADMS